MIKAIIFDFGDVMADDGWKIAINKLSKDNKLTKEQITKAFENKLWHSYEKGLITEDIYWKEVENILGKKAGQMFRNIQISNYKIRPRMTTLVKNLKEHFKVALLSNIVAEIKEIEKICFLFDVTLLSYKEKMRKPDKGIYLLMLKKLSLKPENCLFVDDKEENVKAARTIGIEVIQFTSFEVLLEQLKKRDIWTKELINI